MKQFITRRLGYSLLSLFLLSLTIFLFVRVTGDPAILLVEPGASEEDIAAIHQQVRPRSAALGAVRALHGEPAPRRLGQSFYYQHAGARALPRRGCRTRCCWRWSRWRFSLLIGIPSGILAAVRVGRFWDSAGKMFALLGLSLPSFLVGLVLILFFSVYLGWLPSSGSGTALHLHHAGLRARLVFRRRAHAADALLDARGAGLGIRQAGAAQGPAARRW